MNKDKGVPHQPPKVIYVTNHNGRHSKVVGYNWRGEMEIEPHFCHQPTHLAFDRYENIYVADGYNKAVRKFSKDLDIQGAFPVAGNAVGCVVGKDDKLYITDNKCNSVLIYDIHTGQQTETLGGQYPLSKESNFSKPSDVAWDEDGSIIVCDTGNHRVQVFDKHKVWRHSLGEPGNPGTRVEQLNSPMGVTVDDHGTVYVADTGNDRVQVYDMHGNYIETMGQNLSGGPTVNDFRQPMAVALDYFGNIYITDSGNGRVQVFNKRREFLYTITTMGSATPIGISIFRKNYWAHHI